MDKQEQIDLHFLRICLVTSQLSKDWSTKVGAAITTPDGRQLSLGYNGFPRGVVETEEKWARPEKYEWVVHGEENALINAPFDTKGCTLYCTFKPCHKCMGRVINAGIIRVVYFESEWNQSRTDILDELLSHVLVKTYPLDPISKNILEAYKC